MTYLSLEVCNEVTVKSTKTDKTCCVCDLRMRQGDFCEILKVLYVTFLQRSVNRNSSKERILFKH